jgi:hypothetical protein
MALLAPLEITRINLLLLFVVISFLRVSIFIFYFLFNGLVKFEFYPVEILVIVFLVYVSWIYFSFSFVKHMLY